MSPRLRGLALVAGWLAGALAFQLAAPPLPADDSSVPVESKIPPPVGNPFIQYGVAFTTEFVATPGRMCSGAASAQPCIFGSGGGIVFPRIGWRAAGPWYVGFAAEFSKQDAFTLYKLPILQQYRGEARYYFLIGQVLTPFVGASAGLAMYGDTWAVQTFGPDVSATFGVEAQVSRGTVVALAFNYRAMYFGSFVDSSNTVR